MKQKLLIIVSGPPSTGKSTLAKSLSQKFKLPLITKDSIKEIIFDDLGWSNRQWSQKVGTASYSLIHYFLDSFMAFGSSLIIESNFKAEFETKEILSRLKKYNYFPIQIMCQSDGQVLFNRFKARSESGQRHPGHCDTSNYEELKPLLLKGKFEPMKIGGKTLIFDSTDLKNLDYKPIINEINKFI